MNNSKFYKHPKTGVTNGIDTKVCDPVSQMKLSEQVSFFLPGNDAERAYILARENKRRGDVRAALDQMWERCRHLVGDKDFQEEAKKHYNAATWHLLLLNCLLDQSHRVEPTSGAGPDILLLTPDDKKVWIEAIAVKPGTGADRVEQPPEMQVYSPDDPKIILRHTAALKEKTQKYLFYRNRGYVGADEPYLIALNVGCVPDAEAIADGLVSYLEQAVFGIGDEQVHISVATGEITGVSHVVQREIQKPSNGAAVPTVAFMGDDYAGVSGVIYTANHFINSYRENGKDISVLHNPKATNPIEREWLRFGREKWVEGNYLRMKKLDNKI